MQPQENPARVHLELHGNSTEGLFLKNLYCLDCWPHHNNYTLFLVVRRYHGWIDTSNADISTKLSKWHICFLGIVLISHIIMIINTDKRHCIYFNFNKFQPILSTIKIASSMEMKIWKRYIVLFVLLRPYDTILVDISIFFVVHVCLF